MKTAPKNQIIVKITAKSEITASVSLGINLYLQRGFTPGVYLHKLGQRNVGLGPAMVPLLSSGSPAIPADTAEPPFLSLIIFYGPLVPFLGF